MQVKCTACQCIGTVEHLTTKHFIVHFVTVADLEAERKGHARQAVLKNFQGGGGGGGGGGISRVYQSGGKEVRLIHEYL